MFVKKYIIFSSMLAFATVHASETSDSSLFLEGIKLAESGDVGEVLKHRATGVAENYVETETKSALSPYLNYLEVSVDAGDSLSGSTYEIIGIKAYDNGGLQRGYFFNQIGLNYYDSRTTINLGLGYRYLTEDEKWLLGANVFYDRELPDDHERAGAGIEIKSSVFKLTYNLYDGQSDYKTDRSGTKSKALDGSDLRFDLTLPYLPGLAVGYKKFEWEGDAGASNLKGKELSLKGKLHSSFHIDVGRTYYDDSARVDDNWIKLTYQLSFGKTKKESLIYDLSKQAYKFSSVKHEKYKPVQRENRIVKQKQFAATVSGN